MTYQILLIMCLLKPLYNNHSYNHGKYEVDCNEKKNSIDSLILFTFNIYYTYNQLDIAT
jgi:hypothetical protein